jgi:hypothetical protein
MASANPCVAIASVPMPAAAAAAPAGSSHNACVAAVACWDDLNEAVDGKGGADGEPAAERLEGRLAQLGDDAVGVTRGPLHIAEGSARLAE